MTFSDIQEGSSIYIDSNVLVYHSTGTSDECQNLLQRCEVNDITGVTGVHVLLEVAHRLMMIEAVNRGLVTAGNVPNKLKRGPEVIQELTDYWTSVQEFIGMGIVIAQVDISDIEASFKWRRVFGLLVNDSISLAIMERYGTQAIATNDRDFERVGEIEVYRPSDV